MKSRRLICDESGAAVNDVKCRARALVALVREEDFRGYIVNMPMLRALSIASIVFVAVACGQGAGSGAADAGSANDDGNGGGGSGGGAGKDGGASSRDGGSARDGGATTSGDSGSGETTNVEDHLTFSGCTPDMSNLDVVTNVESFDSIGIVNGTNPLGGDVQVALQNTSLTVVDLSTAERVGPPQNDLVINVMAGGDIFTNLCNTTAGGCTYDPGSHTYVGDPITGTFTIRAYDPRNGKLDVTFDGVVLQSTNGTALCTVNGTLSSDHPYP